MTEPRISIIAAIARENRAIGKDNQLLWSIPEDMKHFRELTSGHTVIMGQKTFESIGRALPNRTNIILSLDENFFHEGAIVCHSIEEAVEKAREIKREEIFIIGGGMVYEQFLPLAERLYLTLVDGHFEGDVFFPEYGDFTKLISRERKEDEKYEYEFVVLER
ncbi:MAG: dihydrofolate reductase [Candidatus Moraniibacteriota bacterium]